MFPDYELLIIVQMIYTVSYITVLDNLFKV